MPITRRQFDLGITGDLEEVMRRIHLQLAVHKAQAFTLEELTGMLGVDSELLFDALEKLETVRAVESRRLNNTSYYAFSAELPALH